MHFNVMEDHRKPLTTRKFDEGTFFTNNQVMETELVNTIDCDAPSKKTILESHF